MKPFVLAIGLLLCTHNINAQEKMRSFESLYNYLDKTYLGNDKDLMLGLQAGLREMCDYRNMQATYVKEQLTPLAGKTGRTVSELFVDSMFAGIKTVLLPRKFSKEFSEQKTKLSALTDLHCNCAKKAKGETALDKLNSISDCLDRKPESDVIIMAIIKETAASDVERMQNASEAYTFIHCPVFSGLLKDLVNSNLPDDDDESEVESLMLQKIRTARGYWQRRSMDSLANVFPGHQQYTIHLKGAFDARAATVKNDFEVKKINGLPALEYTYYSGRGKDLIIIDRVVFTFSGKSASAVIRSAETIAFENIPGGQKLLQKMREETEGTPPPPPPPKRKN